MVVEIFAGIMFHESVKKLGSQNLHGFNFRNVHLWGARATFVLISRILNLTLSLDTALLTAILSRDCHVMAYHHS